MSSVLEQSNGFIDVTDRIEVYEKGKVFECDCGQDIGIVMDRESVRCATCGKVCVDEKFDEREFVSPDNQTSITDW